MVIIRMKTNKEIKTFPFKQCVIPGTTKEMAEEAEIEAAYKAMPFIQKTSAAGFIAKVNDENSKTGKILEQWDNKQICCGETYRNNRYTIKDKFDHVWAIIGTEKECNEMAERTNAKATCWADVTACVEHIAGSVWQTVFTDPYKD